MSGREIGRYIETYAEVLKMKPSKYDSANLIRLVKDELKLHAELN